ncbi:VWA domain-containing protein [Pseudactinotalea sp. HY160]|uniref:vWA domain-containing protein n=1 Tax=Pseudactinotalea sp. HY160 TaxID=2654490 RepID=UPI00128C91BA|nr:vWA domain-containing protein [Pseudactinotalea sp. HY160]MPV50591.1 VWA domain-containing protein [Pseudactinotalea sp. HY160]
MSLQPLWPIWLLAVVFVPLAALAVWQLARSRGPRRMDWIRRCALLAVVVFIGLGPSTQARIPDGLTSNAELYFVVDRTGSMGALDYSGDEPRLAGVRADMEALTDVFPAASYSILAFDSTATQQLPLTTDARAVRSWAETVTPELSAYSAGSSIDRPLEALTTTLERAATERPENVRLVFLLSDGENTRASGSNPDTVASFTPLAPLVDGGAVLGYGTSEGGQMPLVTGSGSSSSERIIDPATGEPAISRIDENALRTVAADLGIEYLHRIDDSSLDSLADDVDLSTITGDGRRDILTYEGFYWIAALAVAGLLGWEAWSLVREVPKRSWMRGRAARSRAASGGAGGHGGAGRSTDGGGIGSGPSGGLDTAPSAAASHLVGESRQMAGRRP